MVDSKPPAKPPNLLVLVEAHLYQEVKHGYPEDEHQYSPNRFSSERHIERDIRREGEEDHQHARSHVPAEWRINSKASCSIYP